MIARVFPRKTKASPDDGLAFFGPPPIPYPDISEVHVSVTFTYDKDKAEWLAEQWNKVAPVSLGGPAYDDPGDLFIPGLYVKPGYLITSRGCPNNCWFCDVHKREGSIRELPIMDGWNLLDSNILACSYQHIQAVFSTLRESGHNVELTGGLEAARLTRRHVAMLWDLHPTQMFFAYDTPDDLEPLANAAELLRETIFTRNHLRCYVLIGYPKDTFQQATERLMTAWRLGFTPMAMLWKNKKGEEDIEWARFQRLWARPAAIRSMARKEFRE